MFFRASKLKTAIVLFLATGCAKVPPDPIPKLLKNKPGAVFVFLSPDCPLSQNYSPTLNQVRSQFQPNGIEFYAVFAGKPVVDDFIATYKITFPVLMDSDFRLADFFGATKTPEVFVLDPHGNFIYKGAIDNRAPELGQQRTVITEHYLLDALNSIVQHQTLRLKQTPSVGCFIERRTD
jgi:thiol-disulfide isomerase/thioredoxin